MSKQVPYHLVIQQMEKRIDLLEEENADLKVRIQKIEDSLWKAL